MGGWIYPDIRRVFSYHGAEHKTINAFEDGAELTLSRLRSIHSNTLAAAQAFLLTLVLLSVVVFLFTRTTAHVLAACQPG